MEIKKVNTDLLYKELSKMIYLNKSQALIKLNVNHVQIC